MKEKKREDNEGGNFQIRTSGKLESRKWLHYRHLEMQINFYFFSLKSSGFPGGSDGKSTCLQCGRPRFDPWVGKILWRREWKPTPVLLPGKFHGRRSLVGYSPWGCKESDTTERLHLNFKKLKSKLDFQKSVGGAQGQETKERNQSGGHMRSSALDAEQASLMRKLGFYIHPGVGWNDG